MSIRKKDITVPWDVRSEFRSIYIQNSRAITRNSGRLMLFAGDQKVQQDLCITCGGKGRIVCEKCGGKGKRPS